jgi:hypothetical protein
MSNDNEANNDHSRTSHSSINGTPKKTPPSEQERKILTSVSIFLSVTGVVGFFLTHQVGIVIASNAPLLIVMAHYYPKR